MNILCIDEIKLDTSFPDSQFKIDGYQFPLFRKDRDSKGFGIIVSCGKALLPSACPIAKDRALNNLYRANHLQKKMVYFVCISSSPLQISIKKSSSKKFQTNSLKL